MNIEEVDERDSTWEQHESVFGVYFAKGVDRSISTFDVSKATFSEVQRWAAGEATEDTIIAIALVGLDSRGLKGLTWLFGMDPNDHPVEDLEIRMHAEMMTAKSAAKAGGVVRST